MLLDGANAAVISGSAREFLIGDQKGNLMNLFWFLPTHGDGPGSARPGVSRYAYLRQVAQAASQLGFGGV